MSYQDLRDFLAIVEGKGELKKINEANWDVEMSSISELFLPGRERPQASLVIR